jgi:hypothetical protein
MDYEDRQPSGGGSTRIELFHPGELDTLVEVAA